MKILVTGGNRGLGQVIANELSADSISRSEGYDITKHVHDIAVRSLDYDVFVNNAFDGPPQEEWANFGQTNLYLAVYDLWKEHNKTGHVFNIGSIGAKSIVAPEPRFETYRVSKSALEHASKQGTQAFKQKHVNFKTTLVNLDRLDTPLSRSRDSWTGSAIDCKDVVDFIKYATSVGSTTCIEEITYFCDLVTEDKLT